MQARCKMRESAPACLKTLLIRSITCVMLSAQPLRRFIPFQTLTSDNISHMDFTKTRIKPLVTHAHCSRVPSANAMQPVRPSISTNSSAAGVETRSKRTNSLHHARRSGQTSGRVCPEPTFAGRRRPLLEVAVGGVRVPHGGVRARHGGERHHLGRPSDGTVRQTWRLIH